MNLLTREDLIQAYRAVSPDKEWALGGLDDADIFARAIEAAVIAKMTPDQHPYIDAAITEIEGILK
jgi:hypothetical protein